MGSSNDEGRRAAQPPADAQIMPINGCTKSTKDWRLTNSTLMAYNEMRGPAEHANDNLYGWVDFCRTEAEKSSRPARREGTAKDIIEDLRPLLKDFPPPQDKPDRKAVFRLPRPEYDHMGAPAGPSASNTGWLFRYQSEFFIEKGHILDENKLSHEHGNRTHHALPHPAEGESKDEFSISDGEGRLGEGHISPCTFRLWAEGCERWDRDQKDVKGKQKAPVQSEENDRVVEMEMLENLGPVCDHSISDFGNQTFGYAPKGTGNKLLPSLNSLPPSVPEGYGYRTRPVSAGLNDPITEAEILEALHADDAPVIAGIPAAETRSALLEFRETYNAHKAAAEKLRPSITKVQDRITSGMRALDEVSAEVERRPPVQRSARAIRREAIYRHISEEIRRLHAQMEAKEIEGRRMAVCLNRLYMLERDIGRQLQDKVGLITSNEEEAETMMRELKEKYRA